MTGIIFDFNGTMFFDEKFQEKAWRQFLETKIGREVTEEEFQEYVHGRNSEITLPYFLKRDLTKEEVMSLEEEKEVVYRSLCLESEDFKLADGISEFLDELVERKIPMTIATASALNNVKFFFEHLHLDKWFEFDKVVFNDGTLPGKPEPDLFLKAAEKINMDIEKCIIFEDSKSGIEAARRAKAKTVIGVASMLDIEELETLGATKSINGYCDMEMLMDIVMG